MSSNPRRRPPALVEPLDPRRLLSTTPLPDLTLNALSLLGDHPATYNPGDTLFPVADATCSAGPSRVVTVAYALSPDDIPGNADDIPLSPRHTALAWAHNPLDTTTVPPPLAAPFVDLPATLPPGTYHLVATVDPANDTAESDESNNALLGPAITVANAQGSPDQPNLSLSYPHLASAGPFFPGGTVTATSSPLSTPAAAIPRADVAYVLSADLILGNADDILLGTPSLPTVSPGGPASYDSTFTLPSSTPAGSYHLFATIDPHNAVAESNETDNTLIAADPVTVVGPISDPLPTASPGSTLATTLHLTNRAKHKTLARRTIKTYFSADAKLSRSDTLFSTRHITTPLRPGQSKSLTLSLKIPKTAPHTTHYLITVTTTPAGKRHITYIRLRHPHHHP